MSYGLRAKREVAMGSERWGLLEWRIESAEF